MAAPAPETRCVAVPVAGLQFLEERKKSSLGLGVGGVVLKSEMELCVLECIALLIKN